jgi:hypothetical protein
MEKYEQMVLYLDKTSQILVSWLEKVLLELSSEWWKYNVVAKLSYAQGNHVRDKGISSLSGLDLAALLRIFDQNWNELSPKYKLYYEDRHFLKEMQNIRNRLAYKPNTGYSLDEIYRDFDTIQLFLRLIGADQKIIKELQSTKLDIMQEIRKVPLEHGIKKLGEKEGEIEKSTSIRITGKDILNMEKGDTISASDFSTLIKNSKRHNSENWDGESYKIKNTPMKGINWIGNDNKPLAVIVRSTGKYAEDSRKTYAFEARKGCVKKEIKSNQVLINQKKYNYPILYFEKKGAEYILIGKYSVDKINDTYVTLIPFIKNS